MNKIFSTLFLALALAFVSVAAVSARSARSNGPFAPDGSLTITENSNTDLVRNGHKGAYGLYGILLPEDPGTGERPDRDVTITTVTTPEPNPTPNPNPSPNPNPNPEPSPEPGDGNPGNDKDVGRSGEKCDKGGFCEDGDKGEKGRKGK